MPAILTHYVFTSSLCENDDKYKSVTCLGGQGPDTFFYNGYAPFKKRKNDKLIRGYGGLLHHMNIAPVYNFLLKYTSTKSGEEKDVLYSYIRGFMFHYCLDRNCHPYIFYRSGFTDDPSLSDKFTYSHALFEGYLDSEVTRFYHSSRRDLNAIECDARYVKKISIMFAEMNKAITEQDYIDDDSFYNSWCDFKYMSKVFYSPTGFKRDIYGVFFRNTLLYAMSRPNVVKNNDKLDIMNMKNAEWQDCIDGATHHESIPELIKLAEGDAIKVDAIIAKSKNGGDVLSDITQFVNDIDHDGFRVGAKKQYYKLAWSNLKKSPVKL